MASAAPTTAVTFAPGSNAAHATSTWTVGFTSSAAGALAAPNTVTVTFDAGFVLPAAPVVTFPTGFTGTCTGTTTGSTTGQVVTITLTGTCGLPNSTAGTVTIAGITNPGAGSHPASAFSVATSKDSAANPATAVVVNPTTPTGVTFTPASLLAHATSTWTVGFTPSASGALAAPNTIAVTFDTGFVLPASPAVTFVSGFTGTCTAATGTTSGQVVTITLTGSCVLANSTPATVTIAGITNPGAGSHPASGFSVATSQDTTTANPAAAVVIGPTTPTGVTFSPGSSLPSALSTWTVGFTPSASGALAATNTISVTFGPGFTVPTGQAVTFPSGFGGCTTTTETAVLQVATIPLPAGCTLANATAGAVTIANITNPVAGSYAASGFSVATSQDVTPAHPATPVVIGSSPSAVTFSPGSNLTGALSSWGVGFTTSAAGGLASGDTISVTFAPGFGVPAAPTVTFGTGFLGTCTGTPTGTTVGQVVTFTLTGSCVLTASTAGTLTIDGIANPAPGTYPASAFGVATSKDPAAAHPATAVVINAVANTPTGVTFSPAVATATAVSTWTVGFTPSATGALAAGNTVTVTFDTGFVIPASPAVAFASGFTGCSATTGATTGQVVVITLPAGCSLVASTPATITIAGITNPVAGSYAASTFSLATSKDTSAAHPATPVVITAVGPADPTKTTITAIPTAITANGTSTSTITVQAKDASGTNLSVSGGPVTLATTLGTLGAVTDHSNGTYTATLTSSATAGTATVSGTINAVAITSTATVMFTATPAPDATKTTITASPTSIAASGASTSTITVQAKDSSGTNLTTGGATVTLATTKGTLSAVTDHSNGTYTATLTSPTTAGTATISGTINAAAITSTATVTFTTTGTLTQGPPTSATVPFGAGFNGHLSVTNATGAVFWAETTSPDSTSVVVANTGAISASASLSPGVYAVSGVEIDTNSNTGTWTFSLDVLPPGPPPSNSGYWLVASDGGIFSFGNAGFFGSTGSFRLNRPIVGMASTPDSQGYWLVASDGGIFAFGDAGFFGSTGAFPLNRPIVGMASTPDGRGYWLVASDGGIFAFGDAGFFGSTGAFPLNKPIVGMASTPDGRGYWLVASDGGIFAFGDAGFFGSTGAFPLNKPIVGMGSTPSGHGYWLVASDGGIFAFGDAGFFGSTGSIHLNQPIVGLTSTEDGQGYWMVASDGGIFSFGDAAFNGSTGGSRLNQPIVGMAAT
ncbi:MAG TPA: Ig-like domain-containing protein [Acidimicrobiales bacterium]|nr:Ig-like domain-containing protein [Acidimicrobiales bacterium]